MIWSLGEESEPPDTSDTGPEGATAANRGRQRNDLFLRSIFMQYINKVLKPKL